MVVSVVVSTLVVSFAISSAPLFPVISICPGTHDTSVLALLFSSRKVIAASTNFYIIWLDPGFSFIIEVIEDVLSVNSMILDCCSLEPDRCFQFP